MDFNADKKVLTVKEAAAIMRIGSLLAVSRNLRLIP